MVSLKHYLASSIGKKQIAALSGLLLIGFVIMHLSGNLLLFKGPEAFNGYVDFLHSFGMGLYIAEIGLLLLFLTHMGFTARIVYENKKARPKGYKRDTDEALLARLMPLTGVILLVFLVIHLIDYRFAEMDGVMSLVEGRNLGLYGLVYNSFKTSVFRVFLYLVAMIGIGAHLSHAFQSVFRTFGFFNPKYNDVLKKAGFILGSIVTVGFSSIPLAIYMSII